MNEAELVKRLERLERDNRRLKTLGIAALLIVAALATIGATRPVPNKITAHEFDVVDSSGNVRVKSSMACSPPTHCWPAVSLYNGTGKLLTTIAPGMVAVLSRRGDARIFGNMIQITGYSKGKWTGGLANISVGYTNSGGLFLSGSGGSIFATDDPPDIEIQDTKDYTMDLGSTSLITPATGETHRTSADSIVMFRNDKKHHVIWEAPQ